MDALFYRLALLLIKMFLDPVCDEVETGEQSTPVVKPGYVLVDQIYQEFNTSIIIWCFDFRVVITISFEWL